MTLRWQTKCNAAELESHHPRNLFSDNGLVIIHTGKSSNVNVIIGGVDVGHLAVQAAEL